jgi:nitrate/TMAO reductase-like tetraheme cytochrome c subunit
MTGVPASDPIGPHAVAYGIGIVAVLFLLWILLSRRAPDSPGRHWLLLFAIVMLPGIALTLGANSAMEDAERPEFCGSCHLMQPWMHDLKDPNSTTLAAIHYQNRFILENQCYTCHTDYTMFGPVDAKLAGMRHLWHYATGTYAPPLHIRGSYHFANCLHCHGEAKNFREKHEAVLPQVETGDINCLDCHAPVHPDQEAKR